MTWCSMTCFLAMCFADDTQTIDAFDFRTDADAQRVWHENADRGMSRHVTVVNTDGEAALEIAAPFASQPGLERVYIDREVDLNLAGAGEFSLEILSTAPQAAGRISLYFRSGDGWYAAGGGLESPRWQSLRFSKAAFTVEGTPTGWHKIDGIRIAFWRGQAQDYRVRLRSLKAVAHDVALVIPSAGRGGEYRTALQTAEDVGGMLADLGLGSDAVEDEALSNGALGARKVAILAYNPGLPERAAAALERFAERGGKILLCYQLPAALGRALGFGEPVYHRPQHSGQFAEIRFDAADIQGLPASVRQASWNITSAEPVDFQARVIARWFDDTGSPTGLPAMLLSERGAFFSHIILRDDRDGKKQMLAGILGHLAPELWPQMAQQALQTGVQVGHCQDFDALVQFLRGAPDESVPALLAEAQRELGAARQAAEQQDYSQAVQLAGQVHDHLVKAYLLAQPGKRVEGRAFWNHSGTGAYAGDWDRTARELSEAGFNMVLPNMLWGGRAHYASDVLPRSSTFAKYGDQLTQCVAAARKYGLQIHVWKVNWNLSGAPRDFVDKIRREHRNQVSIDGKEHEWLCPSHPENFRLELASMLEVASKYDVDGLHFDYIRYPDRDKCYCDGCRTRFEEQSGRKVANWPDDCYRGPLRDAYAQWRCDQITRLVKAVHDEAKRLRPDIEISAAVFGAYPACRASVAQDWPAWVKAGYLDFVCPMDYTQSDLQFVALVTNQLKLVGGRIPVYPGIGQWRLSDDRTVGQIFHARALGAPGFTIFDLSRDSITSAVPAVGMGVGREQAATPHRKRGGE